MKRVLAMLVENKPGALARVVGLFHQRGYNIESLNVAPVHDGSYSRLTVATRGTESAVEQIMKQINKLIDIIKVAESGINKSSEILSVKKNGYQMALIGSALMKSAKPELIISEYLMHGRGKK